MPREKLIKHDLDFSQEYPIIPFSIIHQLYVSHGSKRGNIYFIYFICILFSERCKFDQFPAIWISISAKLRNPRILGRHEGATDPASYWHGSSSAPPALLPRPVVALPQPLHGPAPTIPPRITCQEWSTR